LWQTAGDNSLSTQSGTNTLVNTGTFQKIAGSGSATLDWRFNTIGTVNTTSGSLTVNRWIGDNLLQGTLNLAGPILNAPLTVASNGVLNWLGGDLNSVLIVAAGGTLAIPNTV